MDHTGGVDMKHGVDYEATSTILKALADPSRMKIVSLLSCDCRSRGHACTCDTCACDLLEHFDFTQPSLSHHMKVLENAGIVIATKSGTRRKYQLADGFVEGFKHTIDDLFACESSSKNVGANQCACCG